MTKLHLGNQRGTPAGRVAARNVRAATVIALLMTGLGSAPARAGEQILFFDDFAGPTLDPVYAAALPNASWVGNSADAAYLGASGYSFQIKDGATVLRMQNVLNNAQRRGWSSAATYSATGTIRLEVRFNTMVQSPSTGIDELVELWLLDAANPSRHNRIALSAPGYGSSRYLSTVSTVTNITQFYPFYFPDNTWFRLVITGSPTEQLRLSVYNDSGTVELAWVNAGHTLAAYPSGFKFGISQSMGWPGVPYPTDGALDWLRLTRTTSDPAAVPTGSNVPSQPLDTTTGTSPVSMTFSNVSQAGATTLTTAPTGPPPPTGFKYGNPPKYFDIATTATFSGLVTVCINYTGIQFGNESNLKLLHYEGGHWVDITTSVNTTANIICGATASLSPFTVLEYEAQAPVVSNVAAAPNPGPVGTVFALTGTVSDAATGGSKIVAAEYSVNGGPYSPMSAADGAFDSAVENVQAGVSLVSANVYNLCVRGRDEAGNVSEPLCALAAVYDPNGGFVTGGGWILSPPGAYAADPALTGKANFGFVAKYQNGAQIPAGDTQFQFHVAKLAFASTAYEWLVIAGAKAQFKGSGTINGAGDYGFLLMAVDGQANGGGGADRFRIKIWNRQGGGVVYDNQMGKSEMGDDATELGGGSVVIHKP